MNRAILLALLIPGPIINSVAQIGKVGINTTTPSAMLHVMDSSVVFTGWSGGIPGTIGPPPISGTGIRMMWYAQKAAFRAGRVTGTEWDKINVGNYSFAGGINNIASGLQSVAFGNTNKALGDNSFVTGGSNKAGGLSSFAAGVATVANGASGMVVGRFNDSLQVASTVVTPTTPLFLVGNGAGTNARANAMAVLNNGNVGIGVSGLPAYRLHVANSTSGDGGYTNGIFIQNTTSGEAGLSFRNSLLPSGRQWTMGLDQNPNLALSYGAAFSPANTKMMVDTSGRVGIGTPTPNATAIVDMQSTTRGLLIPRMTSAQRLAILPPTPGLLVYDSDKKTIYMNDGVQWLPFALQSGNLQRNVLSENTPEIFDEAQFGYAVAIDDAFAAVGAPYNENYSNMILDNVGTVTIYSRKGSTWNDSDILFGSSPDTDAHFGWSVDLSGEYLIVGSPHEDHVPIDRGTASIYHYNGTSWTTQINRVGTGPNEYCGYSVAIEDGNLVAIGIPGYNAGQGKIDIMTRSGSVWTDIADITLTTPDCGSHVKLSGNKLLAGAFDLNTNVGSFTIFNYDGTAWTEDYESPTFTVKAVDFQGDYIVAANTGNVKVYWFDGSEWSEQATISPEGPPGLGDFGSSVCLSGEHLFIGAKMQDIAGNSEQGIVFVYKRNGSSWVQVSEIKDASGTMNAHFGQSVDGSGGHFIIGSLNGTDTKGAVSFGSIY